MVRKVKQRLIITDEANYKIKALNQEFALEAHSTPHRVGIQLAASAYTIDCIISKFYLLLYCLYLNFYLNGSMDLACLREEYIHSNLHTANMLHRIGSCDMILHPILVDAQILHFLSRLEHVFILKLFFIHVSDFVIRHAVE